MRTINGIRAWSALLCFGGFWLAQGPAYGAAAIPPPTITMIDADSYTVSYTPCGSCPAHGLEEYQPSTGSWSYVGSGTLTFDDRLPGTYRYRAIYLQTFGVGTYLATYGPEASVVIGGGASSATTMPLSAQLAARYRGSSGDVDGDGRRDLMLRLDNGGALGPGAMPANVLLRQSTPGRLSVSVPTAAELSVADYWPDNDLEIDTRDVNIDGYADLVLRDVDEVPGLEGVQNQIVFAPADPSSAGAPALRAVDSALARFSSDIDHHLVDPDYFVDNAPLNYASIYYYTTVCDFGSYGIADAGFYLPCVTYVYNYYIVYRDFSAYDTNAILVAGHDYGIIHGFERAETGLPAIRDLLSRILGVDLGGWPLDDLLGPDNLPADDAERAGIELFAVLAGISDAAAQEPDDEGGAGSGNHDRVLLKGRRVLGRGPFHTALEYHGTTISAHDSDSRALIDGTLVSQVNWSPDRPYLTMLMGYVDSLTPALGYWGTLLAADRGYDDDLPYDLFPSIGKGGFNSNSYVSGIIQVTQGRSTVPMSGFVGGERPVPAGEFF